MANAILFATLGSTIIMVMVMYYANGISDARVKMAKHNDMMTDIKKNAADRVPGYVTMASVSTTVATTLSNFLIGEKTSTGRVAGLPDSGECMIRYITLNLIKKCTTKYAYFTATDTDLKDFIQEGHEGKIKELTDDGLKKITAASAKLTPLGQLNLSNKISESTHVIVAVSLQEGKWFSAYVQVKQDCDLKKAELLYSQILLDASNARNRLGMSSTTTLEDAQAATYQASVGLKELHSIVILLTDQLDGDKVIGQLVGFVMSWVSTTVLIGVYIFVLVAYICVNKYPTTKLTILMSVYIIATVYTAANDSADGLVVSTLFAMYVIFLTGVWSVLPWLLK